MQFSQIRTRMVSLAAVATVAVSALVASPVGAAEVSTEEGLLTLPISGEAVIAKRNTALQLPEGAKLVGTLNPDFTVTGDLLIPETTAKMRILDVPKFGDTTSTVRIVGTEKAVTTINPDGSVTVVNKFRIELPRVASDVLPFVNIVRNTCKSGEITAVLHGDSFDLFNPFPINGTFTIPAFRGCGFSVFGLPAARDVLMTELLSGPDNKMNLMVGPLS